MKTEKYTPGPWKLEVENTSVRTFYHVVSIVGHSVDGVFLQSIGEVYLKKEDGLLVAAAPELLEAAKEAMTLLEPFLQEPGRAIFWKLVQAVKKAEGKES